MIYNLKTNNLCINKTMEVCEVSNYSLYKITLGGAIEKAPRKHRGLMLIPRTH